MSRNYQTVERRKENISAIEPLISAMRTISLSQWRVALNRQTALNAYLQEISRFNMILSRFIENGYAQFNADEEILIIPGSNRGLCGNFNKHLLQKAIKEQLDTHRYYRVFLAGKQLPAIFNSIKTWNPIVMDFPDMHGIQNAARLFSLDSTQSLKNKRITLLYNAYQGASHYRTISKQIYPSVPEKRLESTSEVSKVILDTNPQSLHKKLAQLHFNTQLQACLYSSIASEHSKRYALMENAGQNIDDLVTELEILLQDFRKSKITAETQELAISSGLLASE